MIPIGSGFFRGVRRSLSKPGTPVIFLLWLCAAAYLPFIFKLGFYWDDWVFAWASETMGNDGLARYFSTNRVYWGYLFRQTMPLLGSVPWRWQVFALVCHWVSASALWWALRGVWPRRPEAAAWISALFAVYPGFGQQPIAILTSHFFIVLAAFFLSLGLMVRALRLTGLRKTAFIVASLLLSFVNLVTMEYFILLDLLRPFLVWAALSSTPAVQPGESRRRVITTRLKRTLVEWLPYLLFFVAMLLWRVFIFGLRSDNFQASNYQMVFLEQLKVRPLAAVIDLLGVILGDIWLTVGVAWGRIFALPDPALLGERTMLLLAALALLTAVLAAVFLSQSTSGHLRWGWDAVVLGLTGLLLAGWPFWLTALPVGLTFPNDRFTYPFILGAALLLAGLLAVLPLRHWMRVIMLGLLLGLAVGQHLQVATAFRRDWNRQKALFWQMTWRMPGLEPGTTLLANEWKERFYSDNSLAAPLNWVYAPGNGSEQMAYMFYFPVVRLGYGLPALEAGLPIEQDYLASSFSGSTSQIVAVYFGTDGCFRVLDPQIDVMHWSLKPQMRDAAALSTTAPILASPPGEAARPPEAVFGAELPHNWCYYFEKADLARQQGDWGQVAVLGDEAFNLDDHPNDPTERFVFIEGYAHAGDWERAVEISREAQRITPLIEPLLCRLWERIEGETPSGPKKADSLEAVRTELACGQ